MQICVLNTLSTVSVSARATLEEQDPNWRVDQSRGNSAVEDLGGSGVALPKFAGGQLGPAPPWIEFQPRRPTAAMHRCARVAKLRRQRDAVNRPGIFWNAEKA
jgi:hypothetical protein